MKKTIRLTESDLMRIVKRVLKEQNSRRSVADYKAWREKQDLQKQELLKFLSIVDGGGAAQTKVQKIINTCKKNNFPITQNTNRIADKVYDAIAGIGTDEGKVYAAMGMSRTMDEFCGVVKSYESSYGEDLYTALVLDFDSESEWVQIMRPVRDILLKSQQMAKQKQTSTVQTVTYHQGAGPIPPKTGQRPPVSGTSGSSGRSGTNRTSGHRPTVSGQRPVR